MKIYRGLFHDSNSAAWKKIESANKGELPKKQSSILKIQTEEID